MTISCCEQFFAIVLQNREERLNWGAEWFLGVWKIAAYVTE
jgi:hypothetical protein